MRSVFARRNAFGIGHFAACFLTLCVKLFLAQTHGVISSKNAPKSISRLLRSQSIQRGGSSCANALRVIQGDFEAAKMTNHPRPTDCPLEGAIWGTGIPLYPLRADRLMRSILEEALSVLRKVHCTSRKRHA